MKKVLVLAFFVLLSLHARAETIDPNLAKDDVCGGFEILHINGIMTDLDGAIANREEIARAYGNAHQEHLLRYGLAYNPTNWLVADVQQSFAQLIAQYPGISFRQWLRAIATGVWPSSLPAEAIAEFVGTIGTFVGINRPSAYYDTDLTRMVGEINQFHRSGNRLALVGHSQGSIYSNLIFDRVTAAGAGQITPESLGQYSIAAVTESIRKGMHLTSTNDRVVTLIRLAFPGTLPANITLAQTDTLGHNLIQVYLAQAVGRNAIVSGIGSTLDGLGVGRDFGPFDYYSSFMGQSQWDSCFMYYPSYPCVDSREVGLTTYAVPGNNRPQFVYPGVPETMLGFATQQAYGCYSAYLAQRKARISAGGGVHDIVPPIAGCPLPANAGETIAWRIYSSDGSTMETYVNYWNHISGLARVYVKPMCKRA